MREGQRFCGRCGHELKLAARFCANCGHSVPGSAGQAAAHGSGQDPGAGWQQGSDPPAYAPTATALPVSGPPAAAGDRPGGTASPGPGGPGVYGPGVYGPGVYGPGVYGPGLPPPQAPPGAGPPPWRGTPPPRTPRRPSFLWPLVVALAVLVAGAGTAAGLFLTRHSPAQSSGQPSGQNNVAAASPTTEPPTSTSPPSPPAQVDIQGMTIGIAAVNTDQDATNVATTLATYFSGIDNRNYKQAWDTYTASLQAAVPFQPFSSDLQTSQDSQVAVQSIQHDGNENIEANVAFQSQQAGQYGANQGETCTNWSLDYHMVPAANATSGPVSLSYLIDKVTPIGAGHASC